MKKLGFEMNLVPYQGGGPAMQALLSGDSDLSLAFPSSVGELLEGGKIRVLATAGEKRIYEDVPTLAEIGVPGDIGFMHRFVLAPAGTPQDVLDKLSNVFAEIAQDPEFTTLMERIGEEVHYMTGPEYQVLREEQDVEYKALVTELTSQ
jgi:tripartite-type tricarboxylate transporter receptor subunit TctC